MGIAIHNLSTSDGDIESLDLTSGVRQTASGLLGTTVQLADLVSPSVRRFTASPDEPTRSSTQVIPFVAGGFLYIGAVAVLPTYLFPRFRCSCALIFVSGYWLKAKAAHRPSVRYATDRAPDSDVAFR